MAATLVVFFVTGGVFASWGARIPAVQEALALSPGELALAIVGIEGGAVVGLPLGGALVTRLGSRASLWLALPVYAAAMAAVAFAPTLAALAAALALTAAANSVLDVAMNAQGVELERRLRRPVLSRLHAGHSFGVLAGGLAGTAAAAAGIGVRPHFAAVAATGLFAGLAATTRLPEGPRAADAPLLARPTGRLAALAAIAFCAFLVDGTAINWSAVDLRAEGAGPALAAAAFTAFALAVALGRLVGDSLLARHARGAVVRGAGALAAAGAVLIVAAPAPAPALAGWALLGAGAAVIAPAVLGAAPGAGELPPGVAIAAVTTVGYLGSFTGPPAIGALAELTSLSAALLLLVAACLAIVALAGASLDRAMSSSCDTGVCGSDVPPLVGDILTGTGMTLAQAAAAIERGETPPLSAVQRRIVEDWATRA
jgi:MFS family permease